MSLELKSGAETAGLPTITLGGEAFYIARLPLRRILAIVGLLPKVNATLAKLPKVLAGEVEFGDSDYAPVLETVRQALLPLYPGATADDLLDRPIVLAEINAAIPVIVAQGSSGSAPSGEALATGLSLPTGASSSPTSASN
jgi:hypothetical protein